MSNPLSKDNNSAVNHEVAVPSSYPENFEFAVQGISITSVCILGLLANLICLFVMSRPAMKKGHCSSVNALLSSMAGVDMVVLICRYGKETIFISNLSYVNIDWNKSS